MTFNTYLPLTVSISLISNLFTMAVHDLIIKNESNHDQRFRFTDKTTIRTSSSDRKANIASKTTMDLQALSLQSTMVKSGSKLNSRSQASGEMTSSMYPTCLEPGVTSSSYKLVIPALPRAIQGSCRVCKRLGAKPASKPRTRCQIVLL
jgi:hypothetical protein